MATGEAVMAVEPMLAHPLTRVLSRAQAHQPRPPTVEQPTVTSTSSVDAVTLPSLTRDVDIELSELSRPESSAPSDEPHGEVFTLHPPDSGRSAWSYLVAATLIETFVFGLPYSVGVLHAYWSTEMFRGAEATITLAATLQNGLLYMSSALLGPMLAAMPHWEKQIQAVGLIFSSAGLLGSAFVTQPFHLILTIGIFYPFAGALYLPTATLLYEWFHVRRGLATGIMMAGTGVGGTVFPFIVAALLSRFGYKAMMITVSIAFFGVCASSLFFIKHRVPIGRRAGTHRRRARIDLGFLKRRSFHMGIGVMLMSAMGGFIPSLWIPTFAEMVGSNKPNGTAPLAIMNAASVPGNALMGWLSDRIAVRYVIFISMLLSGVACLALWGFGTVDGLLVVFSVVCGLTALTLVGLFSRVITIIAKDDPTLHPILFAFFTVLKGIGNFTSGPISTGLLNAGTRAFRGAPGAYGSTSYGYLLIYSAATSFVAALAGIAFPTK